MAFLRPSGHILTRFPAYTVVDGTLDTTISFFLFGLSRNNDHPLIVFFIGFEQYLLVKKGKPAYNINHE